jgi:hypothetical protein
MRREGYLVLSHRVGDSDAESLIALAKQNGFEILDSPVRGFGQIELRTGPHDFVYGVTKIKEYLTAKPEPKPAA